MYKAVPASCTVVVVKPMRILSSVMKRRIPAVAIAVFAVVAVSMLLSSGFASAEGPKVIRGYIEDSVGPLEGANVVLEVWTPLDVLRFTDSYTSDSIGFYSFTLSSIDGDWHDGDTFNVIATYKGHQMNESQLDDGTPLQNIDVTFPFEIPQFGSLLGFSVAAGGIGLIALVFVVRRKKN